MNTGTDTATESRKFVITRLMDAPRELVFKAWTEAARLERWWGPKGFTIRVKTLDVRPGGIFHYSMEAEGRTMWGRFTYREIIAPERIVFVSSFSDEDGGLARAPFFNGAWPLEVLNEVTFTEQDGKTLITICGGPINATEAEWELFAATHDSMRQGFGGTFDQLEEYLAQN